MERKYRHEYKFVVNEMQMTEIEYRLKHLLTLDQHVKEEGSYSIRSVYFDDYRDTCLKENEAGSDPRSKYRIRIYNCSDQKITLERKSKKNSMTLKEAAKLNKEQCISLLHGKALKLTAKEADEYPEVLKQFCVLMMTKRMIPKTIVEYTRVPYLCSNGNVRITLDQNLVSSTDYEHFFEPHILKRPVMPKGNHILEMKYDEYIPLFIKNQLETGHLRQTSYSKYYLSRISAVQGVGGFRL